MVNAFFGIQVLEIGPPYLTRMRQVLVFFHVENIEFYHFNVYYKPTLHGRQIEIKSLNISYHINQLRPTKLIKDHEGQLFYIDNMGAIQMVEYDHSFLA